MAKTRAKKASMPAEPDTPLEPKTHALLEPDKVHQLFGLVGPYDPPPPPITQVGYLTYWDPGVSIQRLREKHHTLFYPNAFLASARFTKETDSWRWRQLRLEPIEPDLTFPDQEKQLTNGDKPAAARELVTLLVLHFMTTGERLNLARWRCRDVLPTGKRVIVGPFSPLGLDIGSVPDHQTSPGIALAVMFTPLRKL